MRAKLGLGKCPAGSGKLWASSDLPAAVWRQQTLGSLRVTSRSRYGEGAEGSGGWTASGGRACAALRDSQTTDMDMDISYYAALLRQTAPVPSYMYTRATGRRLSRRATRLSGISRCNSSCNSTLLVKRPLRRSLSTWRMEPHGARPTKSAYCVF
jgi:hypothetical protein